MKILFSIILNATILFLVAFLLWPDASGQLQAGVVLGCSNCWLMSLDAWKTFLLWWVILGIMNATIRPILKLLSLPFFIFFFGLTVFIVNAVILQLFSFIINDVLVIPWVSYIIVGWVNFVIAVAIFTFLNTLYGLLLFKK